MGIPRSIGFPSILEENGERRVFLPKFIHWLVEMGCKVYLEKGYGEKSGLKFSDYQLDGKKIVEVSREEAFQQDIVMILRSPKLDEFSMLRRGGTLISMLHYATRPQRVVLLQELGINAISLDSIVDRRGIRLVQNMKAVAWNGLEAAFDVLEERFEGLRKNNGEPFRVLVMGTGMVGKHAFDAATKFGSRARHVGLADSESSGVIVLGVGQNITSNPVQMEKLLRETDVLVDTTLRRDPSKPIVPNAWLAWLPAHAVIVDLAVDPYLLDGDPPVVRGIEGIPQGNLDQYIFHPDDPNWTKKIPAEIPSHVRRTSVSCYSWPGIHPKECMKHYEIQLKPLMQELLNVGYAGLVDSRYHFGRAMYRGSLGYFLQQNA